MGPYVGRTNLRFPLLMFVFVRSMLCILNPAKILYGGCHKVPDDLHQGFKTLVFQKYEGFLITCNTDLGYYPIPMSSKEKNPKKILFDSYTCRNNRFELEYKYYKSRHLKCFRGCDEPAKSDRLHVTSEPEDCKKLTSDISITKNTAYYSCNIHCAKGYYTESSSPKQVNIMEVVCKMSIGSTSKSFWNIKDGSDGETFVKCIPGCFLYGSYKEETYGFRLNFKKIGTIAEVPRYESGEIFCNKDDGYLPIAKDYKENFILNCRMGQYWDPPNPEIYCVKGCRKPGGRHGLKPMIGHKFACKEGYQGWYTKCTFACDTSNLYKRVDRNYNILPMPNAEEVNCVDGNLQMGSTKSICVKTCKDSNDCPEDESCLLKIYKDGKDSGYRACKVTSSKGFKLFMEKTESMASSMLVRYFGGYDWLME